MVEVSTTNIEHRVLWGILERPMYEEFKGFANDHDIPECLLQMKICDKNFYKVDVDLMPEFVLGDSMVASPRQYGRDLC